MERQIFIACLCVCLFAPQFSTSERTNELPRGRMQDADRQRESSADLIMKEDAEEVFYNVDLEKYKHIRCPEALPPDHGYILGGGTRVGSVAYIQCDEGYSLEGPTVVVCMLQGDKEARWDPEVERKCIEHKTVVEEESKQPSVEFVKPLAQPSVERHQDLVPEQVENSDNNGPPFIDPRVPESWIGEKKGPALYNRKLNEPETEPEVLLPSTENNPPKRCLPRPAPGSCKAYFKRFYFDRKSAECKSFVYRGCNGNQNNFESIEECHRICLGIE